MKQKILLLLFIGAFFLADAQPVSFGTAAGVGIYSMRGDAVANVKEAFNITNGIVQTAPLTGFYGGGYANIPIGNNLSAEPGLYYASRGYQVTGNYTIKDISILTAAAKAALHTHYIEIPVLLKASFNGLQIFAGPQVSYLAGANLTTKVSALGLNLFNSTIDMTNQLNRWSAGVTAGIGYQFANGIRLNAAYDRGLTKVDAGKNIQSYNQGITVGAAFNF